MPNSLDSTGLTIKTLSEVIASLNSALQTIYGVAINLDSNSPDGQAVATFAQAVIDNLEVLVDVYNALDPEQAAGVNQNKAFALNGLARDPASYTTTPVVVVAAQADTLPGLDAALADPTVTPYAVQDSNGNVFQLVASHVFSAAGTATLTFQAQNPGALGVLPNTITEQNTPRSTISSISNPSISGTVVGTNEETDYAFRIRRDKMFMLASTDPASAVQAALLAPYFTVGYGWSQAVDALVVENDTAGVVNGVPANSIYCVVKNDGTAGHPVGIAKAIVSKKAPGCALSGGQSQAITRANGQSFTGKWDWAVGQRLYINFGITPKVAGVTFDTTKVKNDLAAYLQFFLGQKATIGDVVVAMFNLYPTAIVTGCGVSATAGSYTDTVSPTALLNYYTVAAGDITIS